MENLFLITGGAFAALSLNDLLQSQSKPIVDIDKYHKEKFISLIFTALSAGLILGIGLFYFEK